jgi:DNA repair exonuclease SbcCD ATPase subunit
MKKTLEDRLLEDYGGKGNARLPQTLIFDHVSPATRLLEKRRQMFEVQEALNAQKEEFGRREDAFRRREDGLRRKDLELQESLIKFNKFLQENETKKARALKRQKDEQKQLEVKTTEEKKLLIQLANTQKEELVLKADLEKNLKYQDYLENVVQTMSKFFTEIPDILNRYKTLREANTNLIDKQMGDESSNENMLIKLSSLKKAMENRVLNVNNEIAELQEVYEKEQTETMELQVKVDTATREASEKRLELGQILSSVSNILDRCEESFRIRHNKPKADRSDDKSEGIPLAEKCARTISKLEEIESFMKDLLLITAEYNSDASLRMKYGGGSSLIGVTSSGGSVHTGDPGLGGKSLGNDSKLKADM